MKLIVGLGNPGTSYNKTRHNTGFYVIDRAVDQWLNHESFSLVGSERKKTHESWEFLYHRDCCSTPERVILVKPLTFMNRSGDVVRDILAHIPHDDLSKELLVIHDDLDLVLGRCKIDVNASSAGHHGVEHIIERIGTKGFMRLRIGIMGEAIQSIAGADAVLQKFRPQEWAIMESRTLNIIDGIECLIKKGFPAAQQMINT